MFLVITVQAVLLFRSDFAMIFWNTYKSGRPFHFCAG